MPKTYTRESTKKSGKQQRNVLGRNPRKAAYLSNDAEMAMHFFSNSECAVDIVFRLTSILYKILLFIYGIIGISIDLCLLFII